MPRLLLTGASGFIGRHVRPRLQEQPDVELYQLSHDRVDAANAVQADLSDRIACRRVIEDIRPDVVVHLAGAASVAHARDETTSAWDTNFLATYNLGVALAAVCPSATIVFASSAEVYGAAFNKVTAVTEACVPEPLSIYGHTKFAAELALQDLMGRTGQVILVRLFNSIGPEQDERFVAGAFAAQIARIEAGLSKPTVSVGNLSSTRDFVDVRDTARALAGLVAARASLPEEASIYNLCSNRSRSAQDILESLQAISTASFEIHADPARMRASEVPNASGDSTALRKAIGWQPEIAWNTTLRDILAYWRSKVAPAQ